ncbi:MAG: nitrate reductase [Spongiibacteraceae bacterium]|jgi:anaerobic selenocysteine-containing dehydrogenase|nr:nitrate reductase [Spongiibacteraceae bacterium]
MSTTKLSFCRMCLGHCGMVATIDDDGRLAELQGDHDDGQTLGFACFKGLKSPEAHNSPKRILHPLKRQPDGSFKRISLDQALTEIQHKLSVLLSEKGPESIAGYKGGGAFFTASSSMMLNSFLAAIKSPKAFSTLTIDQSAKAVAAGRIGIWPAGKTPFHRGDVLLVVGGNPLVSVSTNGFDLRNPVKRLKQAKARGMKLIVIDPRESETAKFADVFVQPLPGEDCAILACLLNIILENGWEDKAFCHDHAAQLIELRTAVAGFTPDQVAARAGVTPDILVTAAKTFAHDSHSGAAIGATGPDMATHGNLAEHLIECLNVVCGRFLREGESVNPGFLGEKYPKKAQVIPPPRWWESGYKSRLGDFGLLEGELPTGTLADEILEPGDGQVKALLVHGGNPAASIPDQHKIVRALESLELLVTIEPFMTATARLSDYILPPTLQYERPDLPLFLYETMIYPEPFSRYTPALVAPPADAEVVDDWKIFWRLAKQLGVALSYFGGPLDMSREPSTDDILRICARNAPVSFDTLKAAERGIQIDSNDQVEAGDPDLTSRFQLLPSDIAEELADVATTARPETLPYRLAVRRLRDTLNSAGRDMPSVRQRQPYNHVYMNPTDMQCEDIADEEMLTIRSEHGQIQARAKADPGLRSGVVQISHGFGVLPDSTNYDDNGVNTNLLLSLEYRETINAMPRMSGVPVAVSRTEA